MLSIDEIIDEVNTNLEDIWLNSKNGGLKTSSKYGRMGRK